MRQSKWRQVGIGLFTCNVVVLLLITGAFVEADDQPDPGLRAGGQGEDAIQAGMATAAQLEKLVAPVALYSDALLKEVLDACKHPSAVVGAGDFLHAQQGTVKPDPNWPASITALLHYPNVLMNMDGNLGWATRLGNAWKMQKGDVQDAVNYVRQQAEKAGNLKSNDNQTVSDNDGTYAISSPNASVLYVPQYDPAYLYVPGAFYGGYGYTGAPMLHFATGMAVGAAIASHDYVHGDYPHYRWAHPAAAYGAGVHQGRQQGFAAGATAGHQSFDTFGGGTHIHYHAHNNSNGTMGGRGFAGDNSRGLRGADGGGVGMHRGGGFGGGAHGFSGGAHFGGFHGGGGGGRRR